MDQKHQQLEARFNGIVVFFLCLLIYFLPISIALTETMSGFAIFFFVIKKIVLHIHDVRVLSASRPVTARERRQMIWADCSIAGSPLNLPFGLFILVNLISVVISKFFMISLIAFIAKLLEGCLIYLSFADCVKTRKHLRNFLTIFFVSGLLMGVNGVTQYITHTEFVRGTPLVGGRVASCLRHANDFGAYLLFVIPLLFTFLMAPFSRLSPLQAWKEVLPASTPVAKLLLLVNFSLALVCLGLTTSRGSWIGFLVSLLILAPLKKRYFFWVAGVGLSFMMIFLPFLSHQRDVSFVSDNVTQQAGVDAENKKVDLEKLDFFQRWIEENRHIGFSGMGRTSFWSEAVEVIKRSPFFGSGLNTYSRIVTKYGYAHNCFLQMTAEIGFVGLGLFLFLIGCLYYQALKGFSKISDYFLQAAVAGSSAGLAGFLVQSFFDTSFYSVQLSTLMWVFMGLIVAARNLAWARNN